MKFSLTEFLSNRLVRVQQKRVDKSVAVLATTSPHAVKNCSRRERRNVRKSVEYLNGKYPHYVRNWYESGNPFSDGSRSLLPELLTDARYDQNQLTSREAMRRMRYWEQNSVFVKRALDIGDQYIIGTHLPVVTPMSSDAAWVARAEIVFKEMCDSAGLNDESLYSMLLIGQRRKSVDRDVLFVQTSKPTKLVIRAGTKHETLIDVNRPCYQMVESHRVGNAYGYWPESTNIPEGSQSTDGIEYREIETKMPNGEVTRQKIKVAYWINESQNVYSQDRNPRRIPIEYCYRAATAHRVNETRGISDFYAAEPTLALLEDLLKLEMKAQEVQSDIALFITNGAGQMPTESMSNSLSALGVKVSTGTDGKPIVTVNDIEKAKAVYQTIWGGRTAVGRTGDTLTPLAPVRPAEATLNLWDFLINSFCAAINRPRLLIFPPFTKGQGTQVRAEIEAASAAFIKEFNLVWQPFIHQVWEYFMGWAIRNDERVSNAPADWRKIEISHPRSLVVDQGYDTASSLAELAAGVTNLHTYAQKLGTTKTKLIQQSVNDVFDIKLACAKKAEEGDFAKYGITVEAAEVRNNLSEVVKNLAAQKAAEAQKAAAENQEPATV